MNLTNDGGIRKAAKWIQANPGPFQIIGSFFVAATLVFAVIWVSGQEVEPTTFLLSMLSTLFFALPAIADFLVGGKPISLMTYDELLSYVEHSSISDWRSIQMDRCEEIFHLPDTRLRIVHSWEDEGTQNADFKEKWANSFPDPHARGLWYDIQYDGGTLRRFLLVGVDGCRVNLPCPDLSTMTVKALHDKVARIVARDEQRYNDYLGRAGIDVE